MQAGVFKSWSSIAQLKYLTAQVHITLIQHTHTHPSGWCFWVKSANIISMASTLYVRWKFSKSLDRSSIRAERAGGHPTFLFTLAIIVNWIIWDTIILHLNLVYKNFNMNIVLKLNQVDQLKYWNCRPDLDRTPNSRNISKGQCLISLKKEI